jgi:Flp pilus assembly pilin Flp
MSKARRIRLRLSGRRAEEGQALVEYALILALVTIVAVGTLEVLGQTIVGFLDLIADKMNTISGSVS